MHRVRCHSMRGMARVNQRCEAQHRRCLTHSRSIACAGSRAGGSLAWVDSQSMLPQPGCHRHCDHAGMQAWRVRESGAAVLCVTPGLPLAAHPGRSRRGSRLPGEGHPTSSGHTPAPALAPGTAAVQRGVEAAGQAGGASKGTRGGIGGSGSGVGSSCWHNAVVSRLAPTSPARTASSCCTRCWMAASGRGQLTAASAALSTSGSGWPAPQSVYAGSSSSCSSLDGSASGSSPCREAEQQRQRQRQLALRLTSAASRGRAAARSSGRRGKLQALRPSKVPSSSQRQRWCSAERGCAVGGHLGGSSPAGHAFSTSWVLSRCSLWTGSVKAALKG